MKVYFEYMSHDNQDSWLLYRDENVPESATDPISPTTGNSAITCQKLYPSDYCFISFIPAAKGEKKDEMYHSQKDKFFILIHNRDGSEQMLSKQPYNWEEAVSIGKRFAGLPFSSGKKIWALKKL